MQKAESSRNALKPRPRLRPNVQAWGRGWGVDATGIRPIFFYRERIISKLRKDKLDLKNGFKENRRFHLVVDIIYALGLFDLRQLPSFSGFFERCCEVTPGTKSLFMTNLVKKTSFIMQHRNIINKNEK